MTGRVSFVGAGPGAADLITVRGAKRIAEADIVVWAASLVDPACVREHARADAELVDSSLITHEDVLEIYRRAARDRLMVARVHSGDPSLWGAVQEQYDSAKKIGLEVEIVPGVSAFSAAAAIAGRELTVPEVAQSVILTRLEGGKTPMPEGEHIREFARHGTTMAIFLSAARSGQLVDELRAGGYADDTPVVIAYKATWPDELILHTTIGELSETVKQHKLWRHTLFLVGKALSAGGTRSHLYNAGHFHTYRKADPAARRALRSATSAAPSGPDDATTPTDTEQPTPRPKGSGWPLHTSRSGWMTARVGTWATRSPSTDADAQSETTPPPESKSVAAWSAVRGWQETARAGRAGGRSRASSDAAKSHRPVPADQATLALEGDVAPAESDQRPAPAGTVPTQPTAEPALRLVPAPADGADVAPTSQPVPAESAAQTSAAMPAAAPKSGPKKTTARKSARKAAQKPGAAKATGKPGAANRGAQSGGGAAGRADS